MEYRTFCTEGNRSRIEHRTFCTEGNRSRREHRTFCTEGNRSRKEHRTFCTERNALPHKLRKIPVFSFLCIVLLMIFFIFLAFLLIIVLFLLFRFTVSAYPFGIFNFWPLHCLFVLGLRFLLTPLVSSTFYHYIVFSSSVYGFCLPLWYLQTFGHCIVCSSLVYLKLNRPSILT